MAFGGEFVKDMEARGVPLIDQAEAVTLKIAEIKGQIEMVEAQHEDDGLPIDKTWRARAKHALRMFGAEHQRLTRLASAKKRELQEEKKTGLETRRERMFIAAAKRRLLADVYQAIWDEVDEAEES